MIDPIAVKEFLYTISSAISYGFDLREAVLDFFASATRFTEDPDGDMDPNGKVTDLTTYHITVGHETLRSLVEALEIKVDRESPFDALSRELMTL